WPFLADRPAHGRRSRDPRPLVRGSTVRGRVSALRSVPGRFPGSQSGPAVPSVPEHDIGRGSTRVSRGNPTPGSRVSRGNPALDGRNKRRVCPVSAGLEYRNLGCGSSMVLWNASFERWEVPGARTKWGGGDAQGPEAYRKMESGLTARRGVDHRKL